jgi:hypothetical protein
MAVFRGKSAFSTVSWVSEWAGVAMTFAQSCVERFYRHAWEAESQRQSNEIIVFGWTITLDADGTALAENHLTGETLELDAEQAAEMKRVSALDQSAFPCH